MVEQPVFTHRTQLSKLVLTKGKFKAGRSWTRLCGSLVGLNDRLAATTTSHAFTKILEILLMPSVAAGGVHIRIMCTESLIAICCF